MSTVKIMKNQYTKTCHGQGHSLWDCVEDEELKGISMETGKSSPECFLFIFIEFRNNTNVYSIHVFVHQLLLGTI